MKKFFKNNWTLILVIIYFLFPDLIPGFFDDAAFLFVERAFAVYRNRKRRKKEESKVQKTEVTQTTKAQIQDSEKRTVNQ